MVDTRLGVVARSAAKITTKTTVLYDNDKRDFEVFRHETILHVRRKHDVVAKEGQYRVENVSMEGRDESCRESRRGSW
jgi:hypothetical protein